jgi:CO/xanthine dehydrogenase Mo-binding subunit
MVPRWKTADRPPVYGRQALPTPVGAGETAITLVAAALGNAIFDATAARMRQVPFTPERLTVALEARRA